MLLYNDSSCTAQIEKVEKWVNKLESIMWYGLTKVYTGTTAYIYQSHKPDGWITKLYYNVYPNYSNAL